MKNPFFSFHPKNLTIIYLICIYKISNNLFYKLLENIYKIWKKVKTHDNCSFPKLFRYNTVLDLLKEDKSMAFY